MNDTSNSPCCKVDAIGPASIKICEKLPEFEKLKPEDESIFDELPMKIKRNSVTATGGPPNTGPWTLDEHRKFLEAMCNHGNDWNKVCAIIGTRSPNQARSHAQKFYNKKRKQEIDRIIINGDSKKKIFAVTREFVNRTAIKCAVELMDVPSRNPYKKKRLESDCMDDEHEAEICREEGRDVNIENAVKSAIKPVLEQQEEAKKEEEEVSYVACNNSNRLRNI